MTDATKNGYIMVDYIYLLTLQVWGVVFFCLFLGFCFGLVFFLLCILGRLVSSEHVVLLSFRVFPLLGVLREGGRGGGDD